MTSADDIKVAIEETAKGIYNLWMIGLTNNPGEARRRNGNPLTWRTWEISEGLGLDIVNFFQNKGMTLVVETVTNEPTHLYINL